MCLTHNEHLALIWIARFIGILAFLESTKP